MYDSKARYVRSLFSKVPLEYDLLLGLLSFGQDRKWRAYVVERAMPRPDSVVLDVATGTGLLAADFANAVSNNGLVVGVDLTLSMLQTAKERLRRKRLSGRTEWVLLSYLGRSILKSRTGNQIATLMAEIGLPDTRPVPLTQGIVYAVYGKKR